MTSIRHPVLRVVLRLAFAVVVGVALALAIDVVRTGGASAWLARHRIPAPYVGAGHRVDIGGRSLYLDCRGDGGPTVVLEAGMGGGAGDWAPVINGLAAKGRTCAYDRAGRGSSDPPPSGIRTIADQAADLRALLEAVGEAAPFVVVGHSFGGDVARVFADRYRDDVAGLLLVDSFSPDLENDAVHPLLGDLRPEYEARLDGLRSTVAAVEHLDWPRSESEILATDLAGLSIEVLRAPRADPRLDGATNDAIEAAVVARHESLSPGHVRYELAWGAGHVIQADRPDLVIAAARRLADSS
jgi:pimeloyl-ACP methyl ester carboxylesterase